MKTEDELVQELEPLVDRFAKSAHRNVRDKIQESDIRQYGMIGLLVAIRTHDPSAGESLRTWAKRCIRREAVRGLRSEHASIRPERLETPQSKVIIGTSVGVDAESAPLAYHDGFGAVDDRDEVESIMVRVRPQSQEFLRARFMDGLLIREVADRLGYSDTYAWNTEKRLLKLLRAA